MSESDIWHIAGRLIERHGDRAEWAALQYIEGMRAAGAVIETAACERLTAAIATLRLAWPEPEALS